MVNAFRVNRVPRMGPQDGRLTAADNREVVLDDDGTGIKRHVAVGAQAEHVGFRTAASTASSCRVTCTSPA